MRAGVTDGVEVADLPVFVLLSAGLQQRRIAGVERCYAVGRQRLVAELVVDISVTEDAAVQVLRAGSTLENIFELFVDDLVAELLIDQALQVIKPVVIHQLGNLRDENGIERFAEYAAGDVNFGEAADPQVDLVDAVICPQERVGIGLGDSVADARAVDVGRSVVFVVRV